MRKKVVLMIPVLSAVLLTAAVMLVWFYVFIIPNQISSVSDDISARLKAEKQVSDRVISELTVEKKEFNETIAKLKSKVYNNFGYEMFYGEWGVVGVYVDPVPLRGYPYSEEHLKWLIENFTEWVETKTIQYTRTGLVINNENVVENIRYNFRIFPAKDDYELHFTMKLKEIGLTQVEGNYFVFVEVETADEAYYEGSQFFIKDENTLIAYRGSYCIEYTRISYEGGMEEPIIIVG